MYDRLCLSILLVIYSNVTWAVCENGVDVCLEQHSATGITTIPAVDSEVNGSVPSTTNTVNTNNLVNAITADLKARRLTKPIGDNALAKIRELKKIDPNHDYAVNGVRYVARIYLSMARNDLENTRVERAITRLDAASDVDPSLPGLDAVAEQIRAVSQSQTQSGKQAETKPGVKSSEKAKSTVSTPSIGSDSQVAGSGQLKPVSAGLNSGRNTGMLITPVMVGLPAGTFVMGSESGAENEKPAHQEQIDAFSMSRYEITREQYRAFMADTGAVAVQFDMSEALLPIAGVTADEAIAYTRWLSTKTGKGYRLPTEAEWEYAGRAGTVTPYHSGDVIFGFANCLTCLDEVLQKATPVGSFAPNAFGLYDMHGNVAEWTTSCVSDNYFHSDDRPEQVCTLRVVRGGSWRSTREQVRASYRDGQLSSGRSMDTGFRVVHDGL